MVIGGQPVLDNTVEFYVLKLHGRAEVLYCVGYVRWHNGWGLSISMFGKIQVL